MIAPLVPQTVLPLAIAAGAMGWAAISDIRHYIIPNRTVAAIAASYTVFACSMPASFAIGGVIAGMIVFAVATLFFARGWMGGGDAKLITVAALWAGAPLLSAFTAVTCLSGAVLAIVMLTPARRLMPAPSADAVSLAGGPAPDGMGGGLRQPMPFGVPIAIGGLFVLALYLSQQR
jgi:prepilin peptidase CpaA